MNHVKRETPESLQKRNTAIFDASVHHYSAMDLRDDERAVVQRYFPPAPAQILILGCGTGRTALPLYTQGYEVTAIDISPAMIAEARHRSEERKANIRYLVMDAAEIASHFPPASFDVIFAPFHSLDYIVPLTRRAETLRNCALLLRLSGTLIYSSHNLLFPRVFKQWFARGKGFYAPIRSEEGEPITYLHIAPLERHRLRTYFHHVQSAPRYRFIPPANDMRFKERLARLSASLLDKSFYFIAQRPCS